MLALSIRQPFAELILRGIKTLEYRSRPTRRVGERFWIYASKKTVERRQATGEIWSRDLTAASVPAWLAELAQQVGMISDAELIALPRGVVVGSAIIESVSRIDDATFGWKLADVRRAKTLRMPQGHPQPVWFNPFS